MKQLYVVKTLIKKGYTIEDMCVYPVGSTVEATAKIKEEMDNTYRNLKSWQEGEVISHVKCGDDYVSYKSSKNDYSVPNVVTFTVVEMDEKENENVRISL